MLKHHLIKGSIASGLAIAAAASPATAQARYAPDPPGPSTPPQVVVDPPVTHPASAAQSSFQWGDAGIGAAGTILLLGAGAGTAGAVRRRRTHRALTG
jgi:hypothetical protein